jgi:hypothetical protein
MRKSHDWKGAYYTPNITILHSLFMKRAIRKYQDTSSEPKLQEVSLYKRMQIALISASRNFYLIYYNRQHAPLHYRLKQQFLCRDLAHLSVSGMQISRTKWLILIPHKYLRSRRLLTNHTDWTEKAIPCTPNKSIHIYELPSKFCRLSVCSAWRTSSRNKCVSLDG